MWIVPIKNDIITTTDDTEFTVTGYTNYKSKGPCVYVTHSSGDSAVSVYFFDIKQLNGVKVEFNNASKILNSLGFVKRKIHLPQKHDVIYVDDTNEDEEGNETIVQKKIKVEDIKLHNRNMGLSRGMLIVGDDDVLYPLKSINRIKRTGGDSYFDKSRFVKTYVDYLGYHGTKQ